MYEYKIGYRFKNNDVQGFVGHGLEKRWAEENAFRKIRNKLTFLEEQFDSSRCILSMEGLTNEEQNQIKKDFTNN